MNRSHKPSEGTFVPAMGHNSLPLVSIIVPVFNGERYVRESLDSIVAQTYPRREILVMDDASTDGTPGILAAYGDQVTVHRQLRNRGQFQNVNDGIGMARGEYIAVYHADDVYEPRIVEREVDFLERHPDAGAVFCHDLFMDAGGRVYGRLQIPPELRTGGLLTYPMVFNALLTYKNRFLVGPSGMVRASVYREVGMYRDEEFRIASDLEMWVRIARKYPLGILDEYLLRYRHGHGNSSQVYLHLRTEAERFFKIMDMYLEDGGWALATAQAVAAYEAHRAEDQLMLAINHYILDRRKEARAILRNVAAGQICGSPRVQRARLLVLLLAVRLLVRLPRVPAIANVFYRRWHLNKYADKPTPRVGA